MKTTALSLLLTAGAASASPLESRASGVQGFDISSYQGTVDFSGAYNSGARFVMIKVSFRSPSTILETSIYISHRPQKAQPMSTVPSPATTRGPPMPVSFEVAITLPIRTPVPVQPRPSTSSLTEVVGQMMGRLCPVCWILSTILPARLAMD